MAERPLMSLNAHVRPWMSVDIHGRSLTSQNQGFLEPTARQEPTGRWTTTSNFERPFTPRTKPGEPSNFVKTRFRRFATFDFLAPKKFFGKFFWSKNQFFINLIWFSNQKCLAQIFLSAEKSKVANRLKRVLPKFRADPSFVRGVNGRSKFRKKNRNSQVGVRKSNVAQELHQTRAILVIRYLFERRLANFVFFFETSNGRLPLEQSSDRRETLAKRVSGDLQLFIFRRWKICCTIFFQKNWGRFFFKNHAFWRS